MRIHDITMPLSVDLPVYPDDPPIQIDSWSSIVKGGHANVSRISIGSHSGTHIDPPRHFSDFGMTVDQIPLELLIGKAQVVEISGVQEIGRKELEHLPVRGVQRLLLKTGNSRLWQEEGFRSDYAALTVEGATYLRELGVQLVGIDYLSIEPFDGDGEVHRTLLNGGIVVVEGLNLADVNHGEYQLICLPLKIKDGDGAPVRALLIGGSPEGGLSEPGFDPHTSKWPLA